MPGFHALGLDWGSRRVGVMWEEFDTVFFQNQCRHVELSTTVTLIRESIMFTNLSCVLGPASPGRPCQVVADESRPKRPLHVTARVPQRA